MVTKKVKKKLNVKALLVLLLSLYLIVMLGYYIFTMPIKTINIEGTGILKEEEVIKVAELDNYPSIFRTSSRGIKRKIEELDLVNECKIEKTILGRLTIIIDEAKVLFFNKTNNKYALSNKKETEFKESLVGIPILINYIPDDIYSELIEKMDKIDSNIISLVSEIEYSPDIKDSTMIDKYRFILRMNDGNRIFINIANFEKLNEYKRLFSTIEENEKGTFYLDGSRKNVLFRTFAADKGGKEDELPEDIDKSSSDS